MTDEKMELLSIMDELEETYTPGYLAMFALLCSMVKGRCDNPPVGYSRGDLKRGIRALREIQSLTSYHEEIEEAVLLIRREWLHKEGV